jgi:hypothetical protein
MKYTFGNYDAYSSYHTWSCNADTLEFAIKLFKLECLWPEVYLDKQYFNQKGEDGYRDLVRDDVTGNEYPRNIPSDAFIPIYLIDYDGENKEQEKWMKTHKNLLDFPGHWFDQEPLAKLPFYDAVEVTYNALADTKMLPMPEVTENAVVEIPQENTALMEATQSKPKAREYMRNIMKLRQELELQRDNLAKEIDKFEAIISEKKRILYAIETYLGLYEDVVQLKKGQAADPDEPISVYQLKLFMDEEVGLVALDNENRYDQGMDFEDLDKFDEWITENYEKFAYYPKSVIAWQVRREKKQYDPNPFVDSMMNKENFHTYFLIRNGENLYRIDSNVHIPDVTFPTAKDFDDAVKKDQEWHHDGKDIKEYIEKHMYVMIALQGLVDRTPIFGNLAGKADFINPRNFNSDYIRLVRDAETDHQLTDGRPTWNDFIHQNRASITIGTRVMIDFTLTNRDGYNEKKKRVTGMSSWGAIAPDTGEIFVIQDYKKDRGYGSYGNYQIKYNPGDDVWVSDGWGTGEYHPRKNRVSYWAYDSELLNIDAINYEEISYYLHNRLYRRSYLTMLTLMRKAYRIKKEEYDAEEPFAKLLAKETNTSVKQAHNAIDWWKLKNKWKRSVSADESKAYRMIKRKLLHEEENEQD